MMSMNEELQSANEKLIAMNYQLRERVDKVEAARADLADLFDATDFAAVSLDEALRVKRFTPASQALFSLIANDAGRPLSEIQCKFDDSNLMADTEAARHSLARHEREIRAHNTRWYLRRCLAHRSRNGQIKSVVITFTDITNLKRHAHSLEQNEGQLDLAVSGIDRDMSEHQHAVEHVHSQEAQLQQLADAVPVLISYIDRKGRYIFNNAVHREWFGFTADPGAAHSMLQVLSEDAYLRIQPHLESALAGHQVSFDSWLEHQRFGRREFQVNYIPQLDSDDNVFGFYSVMTDITERKQAEANTLGQQARMAQADRIAAMGELITTIAHELNQPLGAISNYVGGLTRRLKHGQPLDAVSPIVRKISTQTQAASQIVQRLREYIGQQSNSLERIDLNASIRKALDLTENLLKQHGIKVETALAPALPAIEADAIQLEQVIVNLIRNAVEAMDEIDLGARNLAIYSSSNNQGRILIAVHDNGKGIAAQDLKHIFDAFYTGSRAGGIGMGLAISRSIVEAHGGNLRAESNPNDGSQFTVCLPTDEREAAPYDEGST